MPAIGPGYWQYEQSGVLAPVVLAYLHGCVLNDVEIGIMRKYLYQWVTRGDWRDDNLVAMLTAAVSQIQSNEDMKRSIADLVRYGMDPL